jgi:catechol 2,3-dioxygenase-like lactoylglutathione lyase family enzyme
LPFPWATMPALSGLLETALHVDDLSRSSDFYERILGLERIAGDQRFRAYSVGGKNVLLLFLRGATGESYHFPGGFIPAHGGSGQLHVAFSIAHVDLPEWEKRLVSHSVAIESRVFWPLGGESIYFRDPDSHLLELATPGIWPIY